MTKHQVLLISYNFRVGRIERVALDQLFALSGMGIFAVAYYRQERATRENSNYLELEAKRIAQKNVKINVMPEGAFANLEF